jgi:hypothetical protein
MKINRIISRIFDIDNGLLGHILAWVVCTAPVWTIALLFIWYPHMFASSVYKRIFCVLWIGGWSFLFGYYVGKDRHNG